MKQQTEAQAQAHDNTKTHAHARAYLNIPDRSVGAHLIQGQVEIRLRGTRALEKTKPKQRLLFTRTIV
jgi:hypothetical protein